MLSLFLSAMQVASVMGQAAAPVDPEFRPVLAGMTLSADRVRPGDRFAIEFAFRNAGTVVAQHEYTVFLHFEQPEADCRNIRFSAHFQPAVSTVRWQPGTTTAVGPYGVTVPGDATGTYSVHVGVFDAGGTGQRLCEEYRGKLVVDPQAPPHRPHRERLSPAVAAARSQALAGRLHDPLTLDGPTFRFRIEPRTGTWHLTDTRSRELWSSDPCSDGLGEVTLSNGRQTVALALDHAAKAAATADAVTLRYDLAPAPGVTVPVEVVIERQDQPAGLRVRHTVTPTQGWAAAGVSLLRHAFTVTSSDDGYLVVPHRLGILLRADGGLPDTRTFHAYSNASAYSMAFAGAVKNGSAVLVTWGDLDTVLETSGTWADHPLVAGSHALSLSLRQAGEARDFTLVPLGQGGYVQVATAYREFARRRGLLRTWADKAKASPAVQAMFGAADFKPFVYVRSVAGTQWNRGNEDRVSVSYTFDEVAQIAEHLRRDVGVERAMVVLAGWIKRGYDNQHPDILPAAPECGGNDGLADCSRRVQACGFLFGLHDNYQDMYKDAPSWDESFVMRHRNGALHAGGVWAGGQAFLTCSKRAVDLAKRPQNLAEVQRLFKPTIYFIDTTYAAPPYECFDRAHPLTRADDLHWKNELVRYARSCFGLFGSEEGQEWAVPDGDYFEGLMSQKAGTGDDGVVPLFEMVYGDCVNLYTHQGDRAHPARAGYILDHLLYAENAVYQLGNHRYFDSASPGGTPLAPEVATLRQTGPRTFAITYRWRVSGPVADASSAFVHFTSPASSHPEKIAFQNDHPFTPPATSWTPGQAVDDGPYTVAIPDGQEGTFGVRVGLLDSQGNRLALRRAGSEGGRYLLGTVTLAGGTIAFAPQAAPEVDTERAFARADRGWAAALGETDRFVKNTWEVLSALNRLTALVPMTDHQFVSSAPRVERSRFGETEVTVNYGPGPCEVEGAELPENGFLVRSPGFWAFHATRFAGTAYQPSAMFVLEAKDGQPIAQSRQVRVFHAFGDPAVAIGGKTFTVEREAVLDVSGQ